MEIGDNRKKKRKFFLMILLIGAAVAVMFASVVYMAIQLSANNRKDAKEKAENALEQKVVLEYKYNYQQLEKLSFLHEESQIQKFKTSLEDYLTGAGYGEFGTITAEEKVELTAGETGKKVYHFYLDLDNSAGTILEGLYDATLSSYTFGFYQNKNASQPYSWESEKKEETGEAAQGEEITGTDSTGVGEDVGSEGTGTGQTSESTADTPDGTEDMGIVESNVPLSLQGEEILTSSLSMEQLDRLHAEMLKFLEAQSEFRRKLTIRSDSLAVTDASLSFRCIFDTARTDKKNLTVGYQKAEEEFVFLLE